MKEYVLYVLAFLMTGWLFAWVYMFKKAKQIENKDEYSKYISLNIVSLTLPLLIALLSLSIINCNEPIVLNMSHAFLLTLAFLPFWFRSPSNKKFKRRFILCFIFYLLICIPDFILSYATADGCILGESGYTEVKIRKRSF